MTLTVYGHFVSQPARAVLWLLEMKGHPFIFKKVDPILGEAEKPEYLKIAPTGLIPAIVDNAKKVTLFESGAILTYLCEQNKWYDMYPEDARVRGEIQQYLHWHHNGLRRVTPAGFRPIMQKLTGRTPKPISDKDVADMHFAVRVFDEYFLGGGKQFVAGTDGATIADVAAYCELDQVEVLKIFDLDKYNNIKQWMGRMKSLPKHDDVRKTLFKLGVMQSKL